MFKFKYHVTTPAEAIQAMQDHVARIYRLQADKYFTDVQKTKDERRLCAEIRCMHYLVSIALHCRNKARGKHYADLVNELRSVAYDMYLGFAAKYKRESNFP